MLQKRAVGIGAIGLGVFLLLVGIPMNVTSTGTIILNPALFPIVAAWLLILLGGIQVAFPGPAPKLPPLSEPLRFGLFAALTAAAAMALEEVGYLATGIALMALVALFIYERRPLWLAITVIGVPVGIYVFFEYLLERPLP